MGWRWTIGVAVAAMAMAGAARAAAFDARNPTDLVGLITAHGASGGMKTGSDGRTYFGGQAGSLFFEAHFQGCNDKRTLCDTVVLNGAWTSKKLTADEVNRWNRWTLFCPAYLDTDGTPDLWYALSVSPTTNANDLTGEIGTWTNCLHDFDSFLQSPDAFLRSHG